MKAFGKISSTTLLLAALAATIACMGGPRLPDEPDARLRAVGERLAENDLAVLWDALPPSYQTDLEELRPALADALEREEVQRVHRLVRLATKVAREKRDVLLESPTLAMLPQYDTVRAEWDTTVAVLELLVDSELSDPQKVRELDIRAFLAGPASAALSEAHAFTFMPSSGEILDEIGETEIEVLEEEGEYARLRLREPDGKEALVDLRRVEDAWLPLEVTEGWERGVADLHTLLANSEDLERLLENPSYEAALVALETTLRELDEAEGPQVEEALQRGVGRIIGLAMTLRSS